MVQHGATGPALSVYSLPLSALGSEVVALGDGTQLPACSVTLARHTWGYNHKCTQNPACAQTLVKSFEVTELPVRAAKFVARKQWVITGSDDMFIRVYNYNTMDKVKTFEAHTDYIRCAKRGLACWRWWP